MFAPIRAAMLAQLVGFVTYHATAAEERRQRLAYWGLTETTVPIEALLLDKATHLNLRILKNRAMTSLGRLVYVTPLGVGLSLASDSDGAVSFHGWDVVVDDEAPFKIADCIGVPPLVLVPAAAAQLAHSVLSAFADNSAYEDYRREDGWTDEEFSRADRAFVRVLTAGGHPLTDPVWTPGESLDEAADEDEDTEPTPAEAWYGFFLHFTAPYQPADGPLIPLGTAAHVQDVTKQQELVLYAGEYPNKFEVVVPYADVQDIIAKGPYRA